MLDEKVGKPGTQNRGRYHVIKWLKFDWTDFTMVTKKDIWSILYFFETLENAHGIH